MRAVLAIYDASYFTGPFVITGMTFFNTLEDSGPACTPECYDPATCTFSLSTTTKTVVPGAIPLPTDPSEVYAENRGADFQTLTTIALLGPIGPVFSVSGTPFNYDPSVGNLLLEITKNTATHQPSFTSHTDYNGGPGQGRRVPGVARLGQQLGVW